MLSFAIAIGPNHQQVGLACFALEVAFNRLQILLLSDSVPRSAAISPYRAYVGQDVGVEEVERVARAPLPVAIAEILPFSSDTARGWSSSRRR